MARRYCYPTKAWRRLKEFEKEGYESERIKLESAAIDTTIEAKKCGG